VVLLACENHGSVLWAGDSRLYLYRNTRLTLLTRDHNQLEELRSRGALAADEALNHPARNMITRAVGAAETLDLDEDMVDVNDGDMFLLCSDGLSNEVSAQDLRNVLAGSDCAQVAETLIDMALKHGGRDNISAVVVRAEDPHSDKTALNPALKPEG
jgi:protein phosphatase